MFYTHNSTILKCLKILILLIYQEKEVQWKMFNMKTVKVKTKYDSGRNECLYLHTVAVYVTVTVCMVIMKVYIQNIG